MIRAELLTAGLERAFEYPGGVTRVCPDSNTVGYRGNQLKSTRRCGVSNW